jgi:hypothetical protein
MLEVRHFTIFTDHKPITYAFQQKWNKCSLRQFKHVKFEAQFKIHIRHISRQDVVADALSRVKYVTAPPSYDALAASQDRVTTVSIYCETTAGRSQPYVPSPLWLQVFHSVHDLSHPGTKATARLVTQRFVLTGMQ